MAMGRPVGDMTPKTPIAKRLQIILPIDNITAKAHEIGVSPSTLSAWLKGDRAPSMEGLVEIASKTKAPIDWILTGKTGDYRWLIRHYFAKALNITPPDDVVCCLAITLFAQDLTTICCKAVSIWYAVIEEKGYGRFYFYRSDPIDTVDKAKSFIKKFGKTANCSIIEKKVKLALSNVVNDLSNVSVGFPESNIIIKDKSMSFDIQIVGRAAADTSDMTKTELIQDVIGTINAPNTLKAIEVHGDSMSPILLHGQYALITVQDNHPRQGSICVAEIMERDGKLLNEPEYYCKRVLFADGTAIFQSQNAEATPVFTSNKYRLWPVHGVWFNGKIHQAQE